MGRDEGVGAANFVSPQMQDSRLLVLLHGAAANREMWRPQIQAFSDTFRVVAPDLPGHGEHAGQPFAMETALRLVDDLVSVEMQPVLLVGLSLGGFVAMEYAPRYPAKVAAVALSSCGENMTSRLLRLALRINRVVFRLIGTSRLRRLEEKALRKGLPAEFAEPLIARGLAHEVMGQVYDAVLGTDYRQLLSRYPGPVLILNGEGDRFTRMGERSLLAAAPQGRLEIIPRAAHLCNLEQPEQYNEAIRRFAATLEK
jgi:pimeloyl-ACP methyl ester carboxylesterase